MARIGATSKTETDRAAKIYEILQSTYPDARCSLDYSNPLELLVATILAAQCTDARVNIVTKTLFKKYQKPEDYLSVPIEELQEDIQSCGFYRNKAKSIVHACHTILEKYNGTVPGTMDELLELGGVGRKTANVLLGECFNTPGVIVDTHVKRVSGRLGFTKQTDPNKIEQDLMKLWPRDTWTQYSHLLVFHGRKICIAASPRCTMCPLYDLCPYPHTMKEKRRPKK